MSVTFIFSRYLSFLPIGASIVPVSCGITPYSAPRTVTVTIAKAASNMQLSDMEGHWAHNAALVMASVGAMDVRAVGGALLFDPDTAVTREDFLVTVMKALGAGAKSLTGKYRTR